MRENTTKNTQEMRLLKQIDKLTGYYQKLEFLNGKFLKAKTKGEEDLILDMIKALEFFGK